MKDSTQLWTKEELLALGIYELRELGRDIGVVSPTTLKKEDLVNEILKVIYGQSPKREVGKGRGRPARTKKKPCKLFIDLIEKIEAPKVDSSIIYGQNDNVSFDFSQLGVAKVASPKQPYVLDGDGDGVRLTRGVVCFEKDGNFVRKLRFIPSQDDVCLPDNLIEDYGISDNDLIEYLPSKDKSEVAQVIKLNGQLAKRVNVNEKRGQKEESRSIDFNVKCRLWTNQANLLIVPKAQRKEKFEEICEKLKKEGYPLVKVCFDQTLPENLPDAPHLSTTLYSTTLGDEYDTIAMAETAVERALFYNQTEGKSAIVIDNFGWLCSVIETYPKSLYGSFLAKLCRLPMGLGANITIVCLSSDLGEEEVKKLGKMFDIVTIL